MRRETKYFYHFLSFLRKTKIQYRLLAVFCFISLVPVICVGLFSYHIYTKSIDNKLSDSFHQSIISLNQNMILELEKVQAVADALSGSTEVQELLRLGSASFYSNESPLSVIQKIKSNTIYSEYVKSIRILNSSGEAIYDLGYELFQEDSFPIILEEIDRTAPGESLQYIESYRSANRLVLGSKCYSVGGSKSVSGYILLFIDESLLYDKVFSRISFGEGSGILLLDSKGRVLSAQDKELVGSDLSESSLFSQMQEYTEKGENFFNITEQKNKSLVVFTYNSQYECYLAAQIPQSYIASETRMINLALLVLSVVLVLLSLCCTTAIYFSIIIPIRNMVVFCETPIDRMPLSGIHDKSTDELGLLSRTMESMLCNLQESMEKNKKDEQEKHNLELQMLQYQINPHFLFNTLNSLQWVAVINDVPVLAEGISSLSTLLKNTLMKNDELISLEEEVTNLKHYFIIQKIRYGNSFDVEYHLEADTMEYRIPRFILQPLVENSIVHGASDSTDVVIITISSYIDKTGLVIEVKDNGKGFTPEQSGLSNSTGIGINNVKKRLKLHYGQENVLQILSENENGTVCRLTIPIKAERGN